MKIYTKKGDTGTTGTFFGKMAKSDRLAQALGAVDELNSWIGVCRETVSPSSIPPLNLRGGKKRGVILELEFKRMQNNLLILGSQMAGSKKRLKSSETIHLEKLIDKLTKDLPKLTNFIYPTGYLQVARAVCRRAEREVVAAEIKEKNILKYLNRLSDALFTMARWVNFKMGIADEVWKD